MAEYINSKVHVAALVHKEANSIAVCNYAYKAGRPNNERFELGAHFLVKK